MNFVIQKILKHPLFSGSFVLVGGSMIINVVNYFYHLLMGRVLGPVDYGVLASVYSILYIVSIIPSSASISIVKFISSAKDNKEKSEIYIAINRFVIRLALVLSVVMMFLSPFISRFLNISNSSIVLLIAPVLFFSLITLVNVSTSQGVLKFMGLVVPNFVSSVLKLVLGLALIWAGFSVLGAMWAVVIAALVSYLVSRRMIVAYIDTKIKPNNYNLKAFYKYSIPVLIQAFAFTSFFTIDVILVKHFFSPFDAGIYAALSTLGKIVFFASSPITAVMFPIVSGRYTKGEKYKKILLASIGATAIISFGVVFIYFLFPNIAISALYGKSYLSASSSLVWMGLFIAFYTVSYLLTNFFLSIGKTNIVYIPLIAVILQVVGIWIWHNSLLGVIQISLAVMAVVCLTLLGYLRYNSYN